MKKESKGCRTDVVVMGKAEEAGKGSVEGLSQEALAGWLEAHEAWDGSRRMWVSRIVHERQAMGARPAPWLQAPRAGSGSAGPGPKEAGQRPSLSEKEEVLESELARKLRLPELYRLVKGMDGLYFTPLPDYPQVGVMGQRILCGAAEVVVRMYPEKLNGVDFSNPVMAIHVLDLFFASRLGENLEDPSRRIVRNALVYCHDIVQAGTPGRGQAALCMESVRYVVSSLLVLV